MTKIITIAPLICAAGASAIEACVDGTCLAHNEEELMKASLLQRKRTSFPTPSTEALVDTAELPEDENFLSADMSHGESVLLELTEGDQGRLGGRKASMAKLKKWALKSLAQSQAPVCERANYNMDQRQYSHQRNCYETLSPCRDGYQPVGVSTCCDACPEGYYSRGGFYSGGTRTCVSCKPGWIDNNPWCVEPCGENFGLAQLPEHCSIAYCARDPIYCRDKYLWIGISALDFFANLLLPNKKGLSAAAKTFKESKEKGHTAWKQLRKTVGKVLESKSVELANQLKKNFKKYIKTKAQELSETIVNEAFTQAAEAFQGEGIGAPNVVPDLAQLGQEMVEAIDPTGVFALKKAIEATDCEELKVPLMPNPLVFQSEQSNACEGHLPIEDYNDCRRAAVTLEINFVEKAEAWDKYPGGCHSGLCDGGKQCVWYNKNLSGAAHGNSQRLCEMRQFKRGRKGLSDCEDSYTVIPNEAACRQAADVMGIPFDSVGDWPKWPKACHVGNNVNTGKTVVWFNTHASGTNWAHYDAVCEVQI